jgi:hypothetical protein
VRLALLVINFNSRLGIPGSLVSATKRYVKRRGQSVNCNNNKGGKSLVTVKLCRLLCVALWPNTSACFGSIAVTFGTLGKPFDRRGLWKFEIRSFSLRSFFDQLPAKAETSHYLVVAFNVCALQIIQQTPALRDHLEQAAPRVVVLFVGLEVFG